MTCYTCYTLKARRAALKKLNQQEVEQACDDMFKRAVNRRRALEQEMQKKAEEALPVHKKVRVVARRRGCGLWL